MKSLLSLSACLLLPLAAFAGEQIRLDTHSAKDKTVSLPAACFNANEWQLDLFGAYSDGNGLDRSGPLQDHGWGGGVGINYFFTENLGIGVDGIGLYGKENRQSDGNSHLDRQKHTTAYTVSGSLFFRLPLTKYPCYAPYVFAGGGYTTDGDEWASAHVGYGSEYRIIPGKVGIFYDTRFTYYGDRYGHADQWNLMSRLGVRIVF